MGEARRGQRSHGDSRSQTETPGSIRTGALKRFRFYPTPPEAPTERCNGKKGRNAAAGFEVEMSPHTEYQRPVFHPPLMPDEGSQSLSALNTNCTRARSPRRTPAFAGVVLYGKSIRKVITGTERCSGVMSWSVAAVHGTSPHAPRAAALRLVDGMSLILAAAKAPKQPNSVCVCVRVCRFVFKCFQRLVADG